MAILYMLMHVSLTRCRMFSTTELCLKLLRRDPKQVWSFATPVHDDAAGTIADGYGRAGVACLLLPCGRGMLRF